MYAPRRETRSFADSVAAELADLRAGTAGYEPGYVRRGLYAEQLERYFARFGRAQVLVLDSDRLANETTAVINEIAAFLGVRELEARDWPRVHVGGYADGPDEIEPVLERLRDFYAPYNARLEELLDSPPTWGSSRRPPTAVDNMNPTHIAIRTLASIAVDAKIPARSIIAVDGDTSSIVSGRP